jgi:hypothetical protein
MKMRCARNLMRKIRKTSFFILKYESKTRPGNAEHRNKFVVLRSGFWKVSKSVRLLSKNFTPIQHVNAEDGSMRNTDITVAAGLTRSAVS